MDIENEKQKIEVGEDSKAGIAAEKSMSMWQAIKAYPKILMWSMFLALPVIGVGYDNQLIGSFWALPAFQKHYGYNYHGKYVVSAPWQAAVGMGGYIGQIIGGLSVNTYLLERWGPRKVLAVGLVSIIGCIFIQFFAPTIEVLFVGELLAGLVGGTFIVIAPTYASEISPMALRGLLTSYCNLCSVMGQFIGQGVVTGFESMDSQWAYRVPFALQFTWPIIVLIGLPFAPESPWWLVRKGDIELAQKTLKRLSRSDEQERIDARIKMMQETNEIEQETTSGTTYLQCLQGSNRKRTEIAVMVYLIQVIGGGSLMGYAILWMETAGMDSKSAFDMGLGLKALGFVGTVLSWPAMTRIGRRTMYFYGEVVLTILLFIIGFLDLSKSYDTNNAYRWSQSALLCIWAFLYDLTIGPICYVLISEISSTRLRGKTIAIATANKAVFGIAMTTAMPYMMNVDHANWRGKAGFFFGGINTLLTLWCFWRIPETKDRTFEELDLLFEQGVPSRQFTKFKTNLD